MAWFNCPYLRAQVELTGDDVIVRLNARTREIEAWEVLFFSTRLLLGDLFELPLAAEMHLVDAG